MENFVSNRTHRKILVVDGRIGFTGGVGIADQWTGDGGNPEHWRDTHYRMAAQKIFSPLVCFAHWKHREQKKKPGFYKFLSTLRDSLVNIYGREKAKISHFFGAGIAGLSAAHEFKQLGYRILDVYFDKSPING